MEVFFVPSHKSINSNPQNYQGVLLTPQMLTELVEKQRTLVSAPEPGG